MRRGRRKRERKKIDEQTSFFWHFVDRGGGGVCRETNRRTASRSRRSGRGVVVYIRVPRIALRSRVLASFWEFAKNGLMEVEE